MKIAIYGAGAMGTVLGALLTKGGVNVDLITRNEAHVQGLKEKGAQIVCAADKTEWNIPVNALLPNEMTEQYDVVFLMTKQRHNAEILEFLLPKLTDDGVICTTQNGLPEESVMQAVGAERTYGCVASYGASFIGEGKVALTSEIKAMSVTVGGYRGGGEKTALLQEILSHAGKATGNENFAKATENLAGARWSKLAINAAFSGLSVVTGQTFGEIAKKRKSKRIALGVLRECLDVANAKGVTLAKMQGHDMQKMLGNRSFFGTAFALIALPFAMKRHKNLRSGMLADVENGRKCEIDFINGVVCKEGKELGVETPLCEKIVEIAHGIENGLYEISPANLDFII
ncbi:MAG: 2-dehydropantoate 2-reductase [Clostridia bacterium]|nr:2-dehydropantoate 2-reductase [Clostridia bacterium]